MSNHGHALAGMDLGWPENHFPSPTALILNHRGYPMQISPAPLRWHIVSTMVGGEWTVALYLLNQAIEVVYPYTLRTSYRNRDPQPAGVALFPGYLFAGLDQARSVAEIVSHSRVKTVLRQGGDLIRLSEKQVDAIRAQAALERDLVFKSNRPEAKWRVGQFQAIPSGHPMEGAPAFVDSLTDGTVHASLGQLRLSWPASATPFENVARCA